MIYTVANKRKNFLMTKLRIFGETFVDDEPQNTNTIDKKRIPRIGKNPENRL